MSKLVIFDLDGVLVEAKEIHFDALKSSLKNLSRNLSIVPSWIFNRKTEIFFLKEYGIKI